MINKKHLLFALLGMSIALNVHSVPSLSTIKHRMKAYWNSEYSKYERKTMLKGLGLYIGGMVVAPLLGIYLYNQYLEKQLGAAALSPEKRAALTLLKEQLEEFYYYYNGKILPITSIALPVATLGYATLTNPHPIPNLKDIK